VTTAEPSTNSLRGQTHRIDRLTGTSLAP
jgi:hypothetical protein